ncbi:MAG: hypothetical protein GVY30_09420 [Chloroflexi bacterium]|jgi:hypothetical protein|nr:hypothetical protein [Chloroflexota bacterium]
MMKDYEQVARAALQDHAAERILAALSEAGLPVIVLKGLALRHRVYAPAERKMSDIDLLVRRVDWKRIDDILRSLGYVVSPDDHDWTPDFAREFMGETPYRKGAMVVDLHWHLTAMSWFRATTAIDLEALWSNALPIDIGSSTALRLCPEDEVIHLCYHTAIHHGLAHPHGCRDILRVLDLEQDTLDWEVLARRARAWRVSVAVWAALMTAREQGRIQHSASSLIPEAALDALGVPRWRQAVLGISVKRAAKGRAALVSGSMRFLGVLLVDRVRDLPGVLFRGLFPRRRWLQLRYDLTPRQAFWRQFTYPIDVMRRALEAVMDRKFGG